MVYYVVRCCQAGDGSMISRPTATEAVEVLDEAVRQGWSLVELTRNRTVITETILRQEAELEMPMVAMPQWASR